MATAACFGDIGFWSTSLPDRLEQPVEWYSDYDALKPLLSKHVAYGDNLLVVGPGLSAIHERLYDSGFRGLTVVDASGEVLQRWRDRSAREGRSIKFERADVTRGLDYTHYSYNSIIDKGTLDCLLCREEGEGDAKAAIRVLHGALKSPGTLIMVSHSPPSMRLHLLRCCGWESIQVKVVWRPALADMASGKTVPAAIQDYHEEQIVSSGAACFYVYVCRKPY